ncbi:receptor-type tyrosine-protein phosphatase mu-like isoform X2 [Ornithodoros turicata]|uniref:receptor-type tyrosine-protein phosphatase mu-like isoform X2 n=1 Tax=Ornithodoros turicata TaxID=34597 RepID=UPI003138EE08
MTSVVKEQNNNQQSNSNKLTINGSKTEKVKQEGSVKMTLVIQKYEAPPGSEKQHVVPLEDLERYVASMKESGGFQEQLSTLKTGQLKPWTVGQKQENKNKNRYSDLLPYDDTRVILHPFKNDPHSDYINANYISGYDRPKAYICTQGPVEKTVADFWRLIWQEEITKFIMAANLIEDGKRKVERYWPESCCKYGDIMVTLISEDVFVDYTIRSFKLHKSGAAAKRVVKQFHFTAWPDHGVPAYPFSLMEVLDLAKATAPSSKAPLLLHCSAGVGRTGTIVLLDMALAMANAEKRVDVMGLLYKLRQQRVNLVETLEQYQFVHEALLDRLFAEPTRKHQELIIPYFNRIRQEKPDCKKTDLELQYDKLKQLSPPLSQELCKFALTPDNRLKNRSIEILPDDTGRPVLGAGASSIYINAVYANGYAKRKQYIATQYPLLITVEDFWQLVYDSGSQTIVLLNDIEPKDDSCPQFWPQTGCMHHRHLRIDHVSNDSTSGVLLRKFKVKNTAKSPKSRIVKLFQLQGWHKGELSPPSVELLLKLLGKVEHWQNKTSKTPTIVSCFNGATACGLFCAASFLSDQLKAERKVDILMAARTVREHRPTFIPHLTQYKWLYEIACALVEAKQGHNRRSQRK